MRHGWKQFMFCEKVGRIILWLAQWEYRYVEGKDIIVHVRTDEGFVLDSFCSVKSKKTCDIYEEKNSAKLINWFIEHIFLNLAVPSIIIMNSALYHKKK